MVPHIHAKIEEHIDEHKNLKSAKEKTHMYVPFFTSFAAQYLLTASTYIYIYIQEHSRPINLDSPHAPSPPPPSLAIRRCFATRFDRSQVRTWGLLGFKNWGDTCGIYGAHTLNPRFLSMRRQCKTLNPEP